MLCVRDYCGAGMKKHHRYWMLVGVLLVAFLVGALVLFSIPREPVYDGKALSVWLDELAAQNYAMRWETNTQQAIAIRTIGTNSIPFLLDQLRSHGSRWQFQVNLLLEKQSFLRYRFPDTNVRLSRATFGFQALGELAEPAIPELLVLVEEKPGFVPSALASIGPTAVPALGQCLTNTLSFSTSAGPVVPIPGNTIGAIHTAINMGRLSFSDVETLLPLIRDWAQSTNRSPAQADYATKFLADFDRQD